jgi:hypothetical protein
MLVQRSHPSNLGWTAGHENYRGQKISILPKGLFFSFFFFLYYFFFTKFLQHSTSKGKSENINPCTINSPFIKGFYNPANLDCYNGKSKNDYEDENLMLESFS